jgi:hypothetical protein
MNMQTYAYNIISNMRAIMISNHKHTPSSQVVCKCSLCLYLRSSTTEIPDIVVLMLLSFLRFSLLASIRPLIFLVSHANSFGSCLSQ